MAISLKFLCIGAIIATNILWIEGAAISRSYANDLYPMLPSEILELRPAMYPEPRNVKYIKSNEIQAEDDKVIYVKLIKMNYRPKNNKRLDEFDITSRESTPKDIFFVKALTNGQFSDQRLKVYRIPEFFAINVYKKNDGMEESLLSRV